MTFCEHRIDIILQIIDPENQKRCMLRTVRSYLETRGKKLDGKVKLSRKEDQELGILIDIQRTFFKEINAVLIREYEN